MKILNLEQIRSAGSLAATPRKTDELYNTTVGPTSNEAQAESRLREPPAYSGPPWPKPMGKDAFYGLAGDIVQKIEPHTESDSAALLVQCLLAFGNVAGRGAHWFAESTPHFTNEFAVIVGESSVARKGTSLDRVLAFFWLADKHWKEHKTASGLVSGEGLIFHIRDSRFDPEGKVEDPGVEDKRLFICESEFAQVLSSGARKDNTLSVVIRNGWDGKKLGSLAKNSGKGADTATNPHVSIVGHIVHAELKAKLANHDAVNGVANRFLWVCSSRSKHLPFGGSLKPEDCADLISQLHTAIAWAKDRGEIGFTPDAANLWTELYPGLNEPAVGIFGAAVSRGPAHVRRLAVIYALLDCKDIVNVDHLKAALAVWQYCFSSAEFLFGGLSAKGREVYERLRGAYPDEMTKTDLFKEFKNNVPADQLSDALAELRDRGMASSRRKTGNGAPSELWKACELNELSPLRHEANP